MARHIKTEMAKRGNHRNQYLALMAAIAFTLPISVRAEPVKNPAETKIAQPTDIFGKKFAQDAEKLDAWYVYTGPDKQSHIKKIKFVGKKKPFFARNGLFNVGLEIPNKDTISYIEGQLAIINIYSAPANVDLAPHTSPGSEMFLILRGGATHIDVDGTHQDFGPGDIVIFEDTTGPGHAGKIGPEGFTAINFHFLLQAPISAVAEGVK